VRVTKAFFSCILVQIRGLIAHYRNERMERMERKWRKTACNECERKQLSCSYERQRCINCGEGFYCEDGLFMATGFVCAHCLHKTSHVVDSRYEAT
jgi:hypothetical protein